MAERYRLSFEWRSHPGGRPSATLRRLGRQVLARLGHSAAEVAVLICDDKEMRELNRTWRGKDRPTDVLSFPDRFEQQDGPPHLGDVAISLDTARRQAEQAGIPLERELNELLIHALLHLSGYDHEADRGEMDEREGELRQELLA